MVLKPVFARTSSLITQASEPRSQNGGLCNQRPAFTSADDLIGIKGQGRNVAKGPNLPAIDLRSQSFTGIFDHDQRVPSGKSHDLRRGGGNTERMNQNYSSGLPAQGSFKAGRIEV